jgi:hypothetical protein
MRYPGPRGSHRSQADNARGIAAGMAGFAGRTVQFLGRHSEVWGKSLQPQTQWRWRESRANPSL